MKCKYKIWNVSLTCVCWESLWLGRHHLFGNFSYCSISVRGTNMSFLLSGLVRPKQLCHAPLAYLASCKSIWNIYLLVQMASSMNQSMKTSDFIGIMLDHLFQQETPELYQFAQMHSFKVKTYLIILHYFRNQTFIQFGILRYSQNWNRASWKHSFSRWDFYNAWLVALCYLKSLVASYIQN